MLTVKLGFGVAHIHEESVQPISMEEEKKERDNKLVELEAKYNKLSQEYERLTRWNSTESCSSFK